MSVLIGTSSLAQPNDLGRKLFIKREQLRLKRHLSRTERALRRRSTMGMSRELQERRARHLDSLHDYWTAGIFPLNTTHPGRTVPLLEDSFGTLCAMAHIIAEDGHYDLVRRLSQADNTVRISQDTGGELGGWIERSGLTREEARRIQPGYSCAMYPDQPGCDAILNPTANTGMHFNFVIMGLFVAFVLTEFLLFRAFKGVGGSASKLALFSITIFGAFSFIALGIGLYLLGVQYEWWLA